MVIIDKILFPCDLTENAAKIVPYVLTVCEKFAGQLYLLFVVEELPLFHPIPYVSAGRDRQKILSDTETAVDLFCREHVSGCPHFQQPILSGDPASAILKTIADKNIDLVVMGSHGRKGLEETIFGSVAENVIKKSAVPLLSVNPYRLK